MTYKQKLKDPRWQKKRLKILERDEFTCFYCGDTKSTLHVHHEVYTDEPWDAPDYCLVTLCEDCHKAESVKFTDLERVLFDTVRNRDKGNMDSIKLLNRITITMKNK